MAGMAERFVIPDDLARAAASQGHEDWLARLPALVARIAAGWQLEIGAPFLPKTSRSRSAGRTRRPRTRLTAFGRGTEPGQYVCAG